MSQTAQEFCRALLTRGDLASKLQPPRQAPATAGSSDGTSTGHRALLPFGRDGTEPSALPTSPAREGILRAAQGAASDGTSGERGFLAARRSRLPGLGDLADPQARIACLSRFAHHELQAIELFAWAILRFRELPLALRRGFLLVLEEEQQHLQLYLDRLAAHGATLSGGGSDYLWRHTAAIAASPDPVLAFLSAVGLTFEQANLDFAGLYRDAFAAAGDGESAAVLEQVHRDEIRHVRLAVRWLARLKQPGESELAAYLRTVPFPLSPARAKGRRFDLQARRQAGLSDELISHIAQAQPYKPTKQAAAPLPAGGESPAKQAVGWAVRGSPPPVVPRQWGTELRASPSSEGPELQAPRSMESRDQEECVSSASRLWLLPNLGAEEDDRPLPKGARGFLRGLHGAWASLFPTGQGPWLLPPGDAAALAAWSTALPGDPAIPALPALASLAPGDASPLLAWINTDGAARQAAELRRTLIGPPPSLVQAVHHKAFAQEEAARLGLVPASLQGLLVPFSADLCRDPDAANAALQAHVAGWPTWLVGPASEATSGERRLAYVLKPALGTSGRGRVHGHALIAADGARRLAGFPAAVAWAELARRGGAILEPWLLRVADYSVQLAITPPSAAAGAARVTILGTTTQVLTPSGQIRGNRGGLTRDDRIVLQGDDSVAVDALVTALTQAAESLAAVAAARGFYGIAGIDAFTFRGPDGVATLRPVVELNARFTTGTVAVGLVRRAQQAGVIPAGPGAWAFLLKAPARPPRDPVRCVCPLDRGPALLWAPAASDLDEACAG